MSGRGRLAFVVACLLAFGLIAAWVTRSTPPPASSGAGSPTATPLPGAGPPAGLTVVDLDSAEQLQDRFNADKGVPRLLLALSPT